jgi:hypothetical protein
VFKVFQSGGQSFLSEKYKKVSKKKMDITVNPVYKGHSKEPENVAFRSSYPFYTG